MACSPPRAAAALRTALAAVLLGAAVAAVLPAPAATAAAAATTAPEVYQVPADRVLRVQGHGYGHGRGLSQWGAQGAATLGRSAASILATYYPGTALQAAGGGTLRVALTRSGAEGRRPTAAGLTDGRYECDRTSAVVAEACLLEVLPQTGLTARLGSAAAAPLPTTVGGAPVLRWRVLNDDAGMRLQSLVGTTWATWGSTAAGPVLFDAPAGEQRVLYASDGSTHVYRGTVSAVRVSATRVVRVNTVGVEDYLRGVVPKESPASWLPAALQAQAVAARSYAVEARTSRTGRAWEICDSTSCQYYAGRSVTLAGRTSGQEAASTDDAVARTAGQVLTYGGRAVRAEFSASNGGWSTAGGAPWLTAREDPWDGAVPNSLHSWSTDLPAALLESRFGLARLDALAVLSRDGRGEWGGRVLDVELRGAGRDGAPLTVRTTGSALLAAAPLSGSTGLRSAWFRPGQPAPADLARSAWTGSGGAVELAARTATGAAGLQTWTPAGGLGGTTSLSGGLRGAPALVSRAGGGTEVFARGTDDAVWTRARTASGWSAWTSLGGVLRSRPAAARGAGETLHVFGTGTDGRVWQRTSVAPGTWSRWTSIGGSPAPGTAPAAVATGADRLDVVVHDASGGVSWRRWAKGAWRDWADLGGDVAGDPAVASADGELTVVVRGADGRARTRTSSSSDAWRSLGGVLTSDPAATAERGSGRLDVFVTGTDGRLWRTSRTAGDWASWSPAA